MIYLIDKNKKLIKLAKEKLDQTKVECHIGDVIRWHKKIKNSRIVTASNPEFDHAGGLDKVLCDKYGFENPKEFMWSRDLFYLISVDDDRKSNKNIIRRALCGVYAYRNKFDIILTGIGTGIGGLDIDILIDEMERVLSRSNLSGSDLSRSDLSWSNLSGSDLSRSNLSRSNLSRSNLSRSNLSGSNLSGSDLSWSNLSGSDLSRSNLSGSDLSRSNLSGSNLSGSNLSRSNLSWSDLWRSDLSGSNLSGSNLSGSEFDGLTVNEFLQKYKINVAKDLKIILYKGVTESRTSPQVGSNEYKTGSIVEEQYCSFSVVDQCKNGLHVCPTQELAAEYGDIVIKVEVNIGDIVAIPGDGSKIRVKKLKVID